VLLAASGYDPSIAPFIGLMALGFVLGVIGHAIRSTPLVALGIVMIFVGTVLLPLLVLGKGSY
jgi:hypothetical protein